MRPSQGLEIKVGLLIIGGITAAIVMIMLSNKLSFDRYYHIAIYLDDAGGLRAGSPVTLAGITIGNVMLIEQAEDVRGAIKVDARIRASERIPKTATLEMSSSGIFGDSFLAFTTHGKGGGYLSTNGSAAVQASPGFLGQASAQARGILKSVSGLLDDATRDDAKRLVHHAADLAEHGSDLARDLDEQNRRLTGVMQNMQTITDNLKTTSDALAHRADAITAHLDATLTTLDATVERVGNRADVALARVTALADDADGLLHDHHASLGALIDNLAVVATHAASIAAAIDSGQGVLGQLVFSRDLARDVDAVAIDARIAIHLLEEHPSSLVWGISRKEQSQMRQDRQRLMMEESFHQDFGEHPAVRPPSTPQAAPAASH